MIIKPVKLDNLDLERLRECVASAGYEMIAKRVNETIVKNQTALEVSASWENTRFLQGFLGGLRCALDVPAILATEISGRTNKR
jgi:hypothetical protein